MLVVTGGAFDVAVQSAEVLCTCCNAAEDATPHGSGTCCSLAALLPLYYAEGKIISWLVEAAVNNLLD